MGNRAACAMAQCESLRYKLLGGLAVRRACYGVVRFIMENGAKGVEVIISGKMRAQRAKAMKFKDGYLISTGEPKKHYIAQAIRHDPMPDAVVIHEPKEELILGPAEPTNEYAEEGAYAAEEA